MLKLFACNAAVPHGAGNGSDNEMQDMVEAEKAAKTGKKPKKKKKKKAKKGKKGKKEKKKKDLTADRPLEHLYVELVSSGLLQRSQRVRSPWRMLKIFGIREEEKSLFNKRACPSCQASAGAGMQADRSVYLADLLQ